MRNLRLGTRLTLLALVMAVPLGTMLVLGVVRERHAALATTHSRLLRLARGAVELADDGLQEASNLVRVLARVPEVRGDADVCHALLKGLVNEHPRLGSMVVVGPNGQVRCGSDRPVMSDVSVGDRLWFKEVTAPGAPSVVTSEMLISRTRGRPTVIVATPLAFPDGTGSLSAGLDVDWFANAVRQVDRLFGAVVTVVSLRDRTVLARSSESEQWVGRVLPESAQLAALRSGAAGVFDGPGFDGVERVVGFARLPGAGLDQAMLTVSLPRAVVVRAADRSLYWSLAGIAAVGLLGALVQGWLANALVLRPVQVLTRAALGSAAGGAAGHVPVEQMRGPEFRLLAHTLNDAGAQLADRERRLEAMATQDGLTGIANRRCFDEVLTSAWAVSQGPLGLAMIDVDHFKSFNDAHGHPEGDRVLREVAQVLAKTLRRRQDLLARYGGEEFVVLLPGIDSAGAVAIGNRLVQAVRDLKIPHARGSGGVVTVSVGVAWVAMPSRGLEPSALIEAADQALYSAKRAGRDRAMADGRLVLMAAQDN